MKPQQYMHDRVQLENAQVMEIAQREEKRALALMTANYDVLLDAAKTISWTYFLHDDHLEYCWLLLEYCKKYESRLTRDAMRTLCEEHFNPGETARLINVYNQYAIAKVSPDDWPKMKDGLLNRYAQQQFHEACCKGNGFIDLFRATSEQRVKIREFVDRLNTIPTSESRFATVSATDIAPASFEFLWGQWIARGAISMVSGLPGAGKSYAVESIVAHVSSGQPLPGELNEKPPESVLMVLSENSWSKIVIPRLNACGADLKRVRKLSEECSGRSWDLSMVSDLEEMSRGCALIVVDPLTAYLPPKMHENHVGEVRALLRPLTAMLERTNRAMLLVHHLNKKADVSAGQRILGSSGWESGVLSTIFVAGDPETEEKGHMIWIPGQKWNGWKRPDGLKFRLATKNSWDEHPRVEWGGTTAVTADEALAPPKRDGTAQEVERWLRTKLEASEMPAKDMFEAGHSEGYSTATIRRVKQRIRVESLRRGDTHFWRLPPVS
jgi:hypothetical protein